MLYATLCTSDQPLPNRVDCTSYDSFIVCSDLRKEFMTVFAKTVAERTAPGQRQDVEQQGTFWTCHTGTQPRQYLHGFRNNFTAPSGRRQTEKEILGWDQGRNMAQPRSWLGIWDANDKSAWSTSVVRRSRVPDGASAVSGGVYASILP